MDKEVRFARTYKTYFVSITVFDGEVVKCSYKDELVSKGDQRFKVVLVRAMKELAIKKPRVFQRLYKSLYLSTRGYKMARDVYQKYNKENNFF